MQTVAKIAQVATTEYNGRKPDAIFVDATGVGAGIVDRLRQMGHKKVTGVQFGAASLDPQCANARAYIWLKCKEWLANGAIDRASTKNGMALEAELTGPCFAHDKRGRIVLEDKKSMERRGMASPDRADSLCLTFSHPVGPIIKSEKKSGYRGRDSLVSAWG